MAELREITPEELESILSEHEKWLESDGKIGVQADLMGRDLGHANFKKADLRHADLSGTILFKANLKGALLTGARLQGADLYIANLQEANLQEANLQEANLIEANLHEANLIDAYLEEANLDTADLSMADLSDAYLAEANLTSACLVEAKLNDADLTNSTLIGVDLSNADLSGVCLDDAVTNRWIIKDVKCTHIFRKGERIDYAEGDFEKAHTQIEELTEIILRTPFSGITQFTGTAIQALINQKLGQDGVLFKGHEALSNDTTKLSFINFMEDSHKEITSLLSDMQTKLNYLYESQKQLDEPQAAIGFKKEIDLKLVPGLVVRPHEINRVLNEQFNKLPPEVQDIIRALQSAIK